MKKKNEIQTYDSSAEKFLSPTNEIRGGGGGGDGVLLGTVSPVSVSLGESMFTFTVTLILNTIESNVHCPKRSSTGDDPSVRLVHAQSGVN